MFGRFHAYEALNPRAAARSASLFSPSSPPHRALGVVALAGVFGAICCGVIGCVRDKATEKGAAPAETAGQEAAPPAEAEAPAEAAAPSAEATEPMSLDDILAAPHRSAEARARDVHRHPKETLEFFGLTPSSTVIEMSPGGGWYTEILAPYLRAQGELHVAVADPELSAYTRRLYEKLDPSPELYDRVERVIFQLPDRTELGPEGSVDLVLTFRSTHGWINRGGAAEVYGAMFRVLKPGGILGVVQHRAADDADPQVSARGGYVPEPYVIELAQAAGFVLDARTDINRNERDTHDHPEGVWTLPPTLRLGDQDRARWEAIGESDRMTLRFRKPS